MNCLPVRFFHAFLAGAAVSLLAALAILQFEQHLQAAPIFRGHGAVTYVPLPHLLTTGTEPITAGDADRDGIPDTWETLYCHTGDTAADAGYDFDFDGLTEKQEYDLSVRTNGTYGNPLGNFKLVPIPSPPGFKNNAAGVPLITTSGMTLIESAKNGTSLFRISGIATGQSTTTTRIFTYAPSTETWSVVTPPANYGSAVLYPTDINSRGQVVGSFYSGSSYKGFCWTPDTTLPAGGVSQEFFLNTSSSSPMGAIPRRISDTGYLLYSTSSGGTLKAADPNRRPIEPIHNSWTPPQYTDVNDFGEYVGMIADPSSWKYVTFLAIPGGPVFLTALSDNDPAWAWAGGNNSPDVDPSQIEWEIIDLFDLEGYWIRPEDLCLYNNGEVGPRKSFSVKVTSDCG